MAVRKPLVQVAGREKELPAGDTLSGVVVSVVAGTGVTVDSTDPANPIVNASGGGGGGAAENPAATILMAQLYGSI